MDKKVIILLISIIFKTKLFSQGLFGVVGNNYFGGSIGFQMSGIRKEDFVSNNLGPNANFFIGKNLNDYFAVQAEIGGGYFRVIADNEKRYFSNINLRMERKLLQLKFKEPNFRSIRLAAQVGGGLFYNAFYRQPNFFGDLGVLCSCQINNKSWLIFQLNSIMGWDLYQGDSDIINGLNIGIKQHF
jgi:hypothetical protein